MKYAVLTIVGTNRYTSKGFKSRKAAVRQMRRRAMRLEQSLDVELDRTENGFESEEGDVSLEVVEVEKARDDHTEGG